MVRSDELIRVDFAASGNSADVVGAGWGAQEPGSRWMLGAESLLTLPKPPGAAAYLLMVAVAPMVLGALMPRQRLTLVVNGVEQPERAVPAATVLTYRIDAAVVDGAETLEILFRHPDGFVPQSLNISPDPRHLSFSVSELALLSAEDVPPTPATARPRGAAPAPTPPEALSDKLLLMQFASFGDNCELGLYQRRYGAEPMDLFRFSGITLASLTGGLEEDFAALCAPEQIAFDIRGHGTTFEYILRHLRYGFESHTLVLEGTLPLSRLLERELKKLFFVRRLLLADLAAGSRIFVVKRNVPIALDDARRLAALLRRFGPNTLLYVVPTMAGAQHGQVDRLEDGLLRGHLDRFLDYAHADGEASDTWRALCRNAYAAWYAARPAQALDETAPVAGPDARTPT